MSPRGRSAADEALAAALAAGRTVADAADAADVSERTAYRRLADDAFRARVTQLRQEMVDRVVGSLAEASGRAVRTLRRLLGASTPAAVRRSAAASILAELTRIRSTVELEERLARLEA